MTTTVPQLPPSGHIYVYDKAWGDAEKLKFKMDGHSWKCRQGEKRPREDTVSQAIHGVHLKGHYARHSEHSTFRRRTYHLSTANSSVSFAARGET